MSAAFAAFLRLSWLSKGISALGHLLEVVHDVSVQLRKSIMRIVLCEVICGLVNRRVRNRALDRRGNMGGITHIGRNACSESSRCRRKQRLFQKEWDLHEWFTGQQHRHTSAVCP